MPFTPDQWDSYRKLMSRKKLEVSENISPELLTWTQQAIDCYNRKAQCKGCIIHENLETPCLMNVVIKKIFALQGHPSKGLSYQEQIRNARNKRGK